jgi:hypothetical protein
MRFISLTLLDGRSVLIRADLISQVSQHEHGCEIWLRQWTVVVSETIEQLNEIVSEKP